MPAHKIDPKVVGAAKLPNGFSWDITEAHVYSRSSDINGFYRSDYRVVLAFRDERQWQADNHMVYCEDLTEADYCFKRKRACIEIAMRNCIQQALGDTAWWHPIVLAYYGSQCPSGQVLFKDEELQPTIDRYFEVYEFRRKFLK